MQSLETAMETFGNILGFVLMAVFLISMIILIFFGRDNESIEKEIELTLEKGKLYSQLKIVLVKRELSQDEDVYHLKGVVDGVSYDIQVNKSDYDYRKQCYEYSLK